MNRFTAALAAAALLFVTGRGRPNLGPKTHDYLLQMRGILDQLNHDG